MDRGRLSRGCLLAFLLTALILCSRPHGAEGQDPDPARIDVTPQAQTAPLGSNVTFECQGNYEIFFVLDESFPLNQPANVRDVAIPRGIYTEFPQSQSENRLFVLASAENNQSIEIHCVSFLNVLVNVASDPVNLTVFGLPLAPTDLTIVGVSPSEIDLSWNAPFTIEGENVTYIVDITNQDSGFSSREPAEGTEFTFAEPEDSPDCSTYTFSVFTENAVGESENPSNVVFRVFPTGPGTVADVAIAVTLAGSPSATLTFQTPILCDDFPPSNYTVALMTDASSDQRDFLASGGMMENIALNALEEDARYSVMVITANQYGSTTSTEFEFFTTDLQQFDVSTTSTTLDITCTLATGSDALGCNVVAVAAGNSTPFWSANLTRTGTELVLMMSFLNSELDLPSGTFSILASDLEADGTIGQLQFEEATSTRAPSTSVFTPTPTPVPTPPLSSAPPPLSSAPTPPATPTTESPESSGLSTQTLIIIVAVAGAGGALFFLIVLVVCIIVCINCRRARKYGLAEHPRTSSHLYSSTPPHKTPPAAEPTKLNMVEYDTNVPEMYATIGGRQENSPEEPKPPGPVVYDVIPNGGGREFEQQEAAKKEGGVPNPVYETVGNSAKGGGTIKKMAENPMYSQPSELQKQAVPYQMVTFERQRQRDPKQIDLTENVSYGALPAPPNGSSAAPS